MAAATIRSEGKGKFTVIDGRQGQSPTTGLDFETAAALMDKINAEILAGNSRGSVTDKTRFKITYRNQFQVIPRGQSFQAINATQDVMDALIEGWDVIKATYLANRSKVAPNYQAMPKALPKGQERPDKAELEPVAVGEPVKA